MERSTGHCIKSVDVLRVAHSNSVVSHPEYGNVPSAATRSPRARTILTSLNYRAEISIRGGRKARAVYSALAPDLDILRGKDERLELSLSRTLITFSLVTEDLASLRANVNSYLRLADASLKCLDSSTL